MNRVQPGRFCFVCAGDIIATTLMGARTGPRWDAMQRQTGCGICDACQRERQDAAKEYIRAVDAVRLAVGLGAVIPQSGSSGSGQRSCVQPRPSLLSQLIQRVKDADRACVHLKMWPADGAGSERGTTK